MWVLTFCALLPASGLVAAAPQDRQPVLGPLVWEVTTGGPVRSTPAVADGVAFVGSTDGSLYALDLERGTPRWTYDAGAPISSSPQIDGSDVLVRDRAGTLHVVDRASGEPSWKHSTGTEPALPWGWEGWDYVLPSPTVQGNRVLFPGGDGILYALGRDEGAVLWTFDAGVRLRATPVVADGKVLFGDGGGRFHALDLTDGSPLWTFDTDGVGSDAAESGFDRRQIYSRAVVAGGRVYFGSRDAQLYALDLDSGRRLWQSDDGTSGWVIARPALDGERLYETRSSSARLRALLPEDGTELWSVVTGGAIFGVPLLHDDQVIVANGAGMLLGYDAATGVERWRYGLGAAVWAEPALAQGRLVVGADDGIVRAFEVRTGPPARLAHFWDPALVGESSLGSRPAHESIADWFGARGYTRLDSAGLLSFLQEREQDGSPSVVVFAMDALPEAAAGDNGPLMRYLRSGGKVVWLGQPPLLVARDGEGRITGFDREAPGALLGVDHSPLVGDAMPVFPTAEGRERGLESFWTGTVTIRPDSASVVLAVDTNGGAVAWQQPYGSGEESGFVLLYATGEDDRLDEIRRVVEYGIFRSPATRSIVAH